MEELKSLKFYLHLCRSIQLGLAGKQYTALALDLLQNLVLHQRHRSPAQKLRFEKNNHWMKEKLTGISSQVCRNGLFGSQVMTIHCKSIC